MIDRFGKFFRLLAPSLLIGISAASAIAQTRGSTISGYVFDPSQRAVSDITVELRNEYNSAVTRLRTDSSGRYYFTGVAHGRYNIRVLPFGTNFMETSVEVEITGIGMRGQAIADNVQKDVYLRLRKSASSTPFINAVIYAQEVPREAQVLYNDAVVDLGRERPQTGVESLERAITIFPTYFAALQRLGAVWLAQGKFEEAAQLFGRALAVNDKSFDCWYGLAYANFSLKKYKDSAVASEKAVLLKPESLEATLLYGMTQRILKDFANAEKTLKKAVKLAEGTSPDVHWQLALLYGKDQTRYAEAAKELEQYLALSPDAPNKEDVKKLIKTFRDKAKNSS
jgi:Flp pilus assembly protein TadD